MDLIKQHYGRTEIIVLIKRGNRAVGMYRLLFIAWIGMWRVKISLPNRKISQILIPEIYYLTKSEILN